MAAGLLGGRRHARPPPAPDRPARRRPGSARRRARHAGRLVPLPLEEVAAFWATLPSSAHHLVRFVPYGPVAVPDGAPLGQALADLLGRRVVVYAGLPSVGPEAGTREVRTLQADGTLGWRPYADEFGFTPRGPNGEPVMAPVPLNTRVPTGATAAVAPGVYRHAPDVLLEVVQSGLWVRPAGEPHDGYVVRSVPADPAFPAILYDQTDPVTADRMRTVAHELLPALDPAFRDRTRVLPSSEAGGCRRAATRCLPSRCCRRRRGPRPPSRPAVRAAGCWRTARVRSRPWRCRPRRAPPAGPTRHPRPGPARWAGRPPRPGPCRGPGRAPLPGRLDAGPETVQLRPPRTPAPVTRPVTGPEQAGPPPRPWQGRRPPGRARRPRRAGLSRTDSSGTDSSGTHPPAAPPPRVRSRVDGVRSEWTEDVPPAASPAGPPPANPAAPPAGSPGRPQPAAPAEPVSPAPCRPRPRPSPPRPRPRPAAAPASPGPRLPSIRLESSPTPPPAATPPRPRAGTTPRRTRSRPPAPGTPAPEPEPPRPAPATPPAAAADRQRRPSHRRHSRSPARYRAPSGSSPNPRPPPSCCRPKGVDRNATGCAAASASATTPRRPWSPGCSQSPGLAGGPRGSTADALTDLAAIRLYLSGSTPDIDAAIRSAVAGPHVPLARCATAGMRRLPSYRGGAILRATLSDAERAWYEEGRLVTEHSFLAALSALRRGLPGNTDVLFWSMTARRTGLLAPEIPDRLLFTPGTRFKVLRSVDGDRPAVLLRELAASEVDEAGNLREERVPLDEIALKGLDQLHALWKQAEQDTEVPAGDPLPDEHADAFRSAPGLLQSQPDRPAGPRPPAASNGPRPQKGQNQ
ncbi:hypothetical protein O1L68_14995 [Streptomyces lydicus]|nr:hypothetical protein [Streptomyces lydicus]